MEPLSFAVVAVTSVISLGIGRTIKHFIEKNRAKKRAQEAREREAQARRDRAAEPESKNRSKRKRQLQQLQQHEKKGESQQR